MTGTAVEIGSVLADALRADDSRHPDGADAGTTAILDATAGLLAEHGLRGWSVEDVAERAGVGRATVYRRFAGRDDLLRTTVTRDARRFFGAIAASVREVDSLPDKVVSGFATGLHLARSSPLGSLLRHDPAAAMTVLTSGPLLESATAALVERYEGLLGRRLDGAERSGAEGGAEALVRLGLSYLLAPGATQDAGVEAVRAHLTTVIGPLVGASGVALQPSGDPGQWDRI